MYKVDPNNSKKSYPKTISRDISYGNSTTPAEEVFQARPNYVLVNVNGTYAFSYADTGSIGGVHKTESTYVTGSVLGNAAGGPIRLDINPNAWRQTDAASGTVGDVTFVYLGESQKEGLGGNL